MPKGGSARRYAQAVFQIAKERGELEEWLIDLKQIAELASNQDLKFLLENPRLSLNEKMLLLKETLKINPLALNLAGILIAKGRLGLAKGIVREYEKLLLEHYGIEEVELVTAIPLEEKEKDYFAQRISQILGKKVILRSSVNPDIIGGLIVRTEGLLLDGSIKSKLESLKRSLIEARR